MIAYRLAFFYVMFFVTSIIVSGEVYDAELISAMSSSEIQGLSGADVADNLGSLEELGKIGELTPEQLGPNMDKLSPDGLAQLKADQLAQPQGNPNIDKIPKEKWSSLNQAEKDKALTQLGRGEDIETAQDGSQTQVTSFDNGFFLDEINFIRIGDIKVNNGRGITYRGGRLNIDSAAKIEIKDGLLTEVKNFAGNFIEFSIGNAKDVINGCVSARDVKDSEFKITDETIEIKPKEGVAFNISDCNFAQSTFKSFSDNSSVEIEKKQNPKYRINEGELECVSLNSKDRIEANNYAEVDYGNSCFSCLTINPIGTYWYNDNREIIKDFGINIPENAPDFKLCLRKNEIQQFNDFDGLINFVDNFIVLNKIVNYLKYPSMNNV